MDISRALFLLSIFVLQAGIVVAILEGSGKPGRRAEGDLDTQSQKSRGGWSSTSRSSTSSWSGSSKSSKTSKSWWGKSTDTPTLYPTVSPTLYPTTSPTLYPTVSPTLYPTMSPTYCGKSHKSGKSGDRKLGSWSTSWSSKTSTSCDKGPRWGSKSTGSSSWWRGVGRDGEGVRRMVVRSTGNQDRPGKRNRRDLKSVDADVDIELKLSGKIKHRRQMEGGVQA